jgi:GH25 family lysozyme M1 (1,4-beta-N-acetylmuramidase)
VPATTPPESSSSTSTTTTTGDPPIGVDVSHWNGLVDWSVPAAAGYGFVYAKASEGTYYVDDTYAAQIEGAIEAGLFHGAYHFAIPDDSDGATQARFLVDHGGGWEADGLTLPAVLDIEWNPNGGSDDCYGLTDGELTDWVWDFADEYRALTGRDAVFYTSRTWWNLCVDATDFGATNPLWVADWDAPEPELPTGWSDYTFWQIDAYGSVPGIGGDVDVDVFNGPPSRLAALAMGQ